MTVNKKHLNNNINVNDLNTSINIHRLVQWIKKENPTIHCLQDTYLIIKGIHRLKVKTGKKHNLWGSHRATGDFILISGKVDFNSKLIRRTKKDISYCFRELHYQQVITIINIYAPNKGGSTCIEQSLLNF